MVGKLDAFPSLLPRRRRPPRSRSPTRAKPPGTLTTSEGRGVDGGEAQAGFRPTAGRGWQRAALAAEAGANRSRCGPMTPSCRTRRRAFESSGPPSTSPAAFASYCDKMVFHRALGCMVGQNTPWCQGIGGTVITPFSAASGAVVTQVFALTCQDAAPFLLPTGSCVASRLASAESASMPTMASTRRRPHSWFPRLRTLPNRISESS